MAKEQPIGSTFVGEDVGELWHSIIWGAQYHLRNMKELHKQAEEASANGQYRIASALNRAASDEYGHMLTAVYPIKSTIQARTRREKIEAEHLASDGRAKFVTVSCAGEACGDCERPLWQHLTVDDSSFLMCPFGRRYWAIARAVDARGRGVDKDDTRALMATISRG